MRAILLFLFGTPVMMCPRLISAVSPELDSSKNSLRTSHLGESNVSEDGPAHRGSFFMRFGDLAPRQKVMGLVNAIALLRTKISLIEEMRTAFEPRMGGPPNGPQNGHMLPGPALAYGDCRLGILGFEVCRHLGFLDSDPMVAPSSTQSKLLRLIGASSLVSSLKAGHLNLHDDAELNFIMGPELMDSAVRALGACWNAHLLIPAFDARPVKPELMREAMNQADGFLFLTAMHAKNILRYSRSAYGDLAGWLASIFSELPAPDTFPMHSDASFPREDKTQKVVENVENEVVRQREEISSTQKKADGSLLGSFFNRLFPPQHQQSPQSQEGEPVPASTPVLSALANSVGGLTSMVASTAQNAVKAVNGEAPHNDSEEAAALERTEKRLGDILDMIPTEVNGQF